MSSASGVDGGSSERLGSGSSKQQQQVAARVSGRREATTASYAGTGTAATTSCLFGFGYRVGCTGKKRPDTAGCVSVSRPKRGKNGQ